MADVVEETIAINFISPSEPVQQITLDGSEENNNVITLQPDEQSTTIQGPNSLVIEANNSADNSSKGSPTNKDAKNKKKKKHKKKKSRKSIADVEDLEQFEAKDENGEINDSHHQTNESIGSVIDEATVPVNNELLMLVNQELLQAEDDDDIPPPPPEIEPYNPPQTISEPVETKSTEAIAFTQPAPITKSTESTTAASTTAPTTTASTTSLSPHGKVHNPTRSIDLRAMAATEELRSFINSYDSNDEGNELTPREIIPKIPIERSESVESTKNLPIIPSSNNVETSAIATNTTASFNPESSGIIDGGDISDEDESDNQHPNGGDTSTNTANTSKLIILNNNDDDDDGEASDLIVKISRQEDNASSSTTTSTSTRKVSETGLLLGFSAATAWDLELSKPVLATPRASSSIAGPLMTTREVLGFKLSDEITHDLTIRTSIDVNSPSTEIKSAGSNTTTSSTSPTIESQNPSNNTTAATNKSTGSDPNSGTSTPITTEKATKAVEGTQIFQRTAKLFEHANQAPANTPLSPSRSHHRRTSKHVLSAIEKFTAENHNSEEQPIKLIPRANSIIQPSNNTGVSPMLAQQTAAVTNRTQSVIVKPTTTTNNFAVKTAAVAPVSTPAKDATTTSVNATATPTTVNSAAKPATTTGSTPISAPNPSQRTSLSAKNTLGRGSIFNNGTIPISPNAKTKCTASKCMSFAVRGDYCLRHLWKFDINPNRNNWGNACDNEKQWKVAMEIYTTEKSYTDSLRIAHRSFELRFQKMLEMNTPLMSKEELDVIFNNLADIFNLSDSIVTDLEEILKEGVFIKQIGSTLLHYSPQFRIYQPYLENYDNAVKKLVNIRKDNIPLETFLKLNESCEGMGLQSFLIMPVQRLPRYLMLLTELIKRTDIHSESLSDMEQAKERIGRIAEAINQSLHAEEGRRVVETIQTQFERDSRFIEFCTPGRYLLIRGDLKKRFSKFSKHLTSYKVYHFFLFNDLLIYAESNKSLGGKVTYKMKHVVPLMGMIISDIKSKGKEKDIEIKTTTTGKHFSIICDTDAQYNEWKTALTTAIAKLEQANNALNVASYDGSADSEKKQRNMAKLAQLMGTAPK